jgi:hypothetical protein
MLRLSPEEQQAVVRAADSAGVPVSTWAREVVVAAARRHVRRQVAAADAALGLVAVAGGER